MKTYWPDYVYNILNSHMKILDKIFRQNQKRNNKVKNVYSTYVKGLVFFKNEHLEINKKLMNNLIKQRNK